MHLPHPEILSECPGEIRPGCRAAEKLFSYQVLICLLLLLLPFAAPAQEYRLRLLDIETGVSRGDLPVPDKPVDAAAAWSFIHKLIPEMHEKGYLAASVDSIYIGEGIYDIYLFTGERYQWADISLARIPEHILLETAVHKHTWEGKPVRPGQLAAFSEKLLNWADDHGYPFARVWLDQVRIASGGGVYGVMQLDKGPVQRIDTVVVHGDVTVSRHYLLRYLDIKQGMPYQEKKLSQLSRRLAELRFLEESAPWEMEFNISGNELHLYLKEKKANQMDALLGLLPNHGETGKLLLTADIQLAFRNILAQGEAISVVYQNLQYRSPRFRAEMVLPYFPGTPVGLDAQFDLYKKDTSFRRTLFQAGLRYQTTASDYIRVFFQQQSNRLISIDTSWIRANKRLPEDADVQATGGGVEWVINRTDYRLNPRKGWEAGLKITGLARRIRQNDLITGMKGDGGFEFASLYDTLMQRQYQLQLTGMLQYYFPLGRAFVLKTFYQGGWVSGKFLFRNELYQIGGFRLLRGFDEQSIFASQYHIGGLELRLLMGKNAYVYLFSDNGYVETAFQESFYADLYNGFGIGTSMETRSGLFTLSYALGRNSMFPAQFRQSRIHFGYLAYF